MQARQTPRRWSRIPGLVLPLAVVGFAAGWLLPGLRAIGFDRVTSWRGEAAASLIAALVGAVISRKLAAVDAPSAFPIRAWRLMGPVFAGGTLTGGVVGGLAARGSDFRWWAEEVRVGAVYGGVSALLFVPICTLLVAAARRAERARSGSLVAGADRRAVWSIPVTTLAVSTLAAVPLLHDQEAIPLPRLGAATAVAAGLVLLAFLLADVRAFFRVRRAGVDRLEAHEPAGARDAGEIPSLDLGLGDELRAHVGRGADAYRSRARPTALVLGSVTAARAALVQGLLHSTLGLTITVAVLAGHAWADTPAALLSRLEPRCRRAAELCRRKIDLGGLCERSTKACYDAGVLRQPAALQGSCPP